MRPYFLFRLAFILLLCFGSQQTANASHVLGGDLSYSYIPGSASRYHIVARMYGRDPNVGVPDLADLPLYFFLNGCNAATPGSFYLTVARTQLTQRNLGCVGNGVYNTSTFEVDVTLPPGRWTISTINENRAGGIRNLVNSGSSSFQASAFLDNSSGLINSSPRFTSFTMPYVCGAQPYRYSFSTFEPDGDSLVYQSVQPLAGLLSNPTCGTPIAYASYAAGQFQDPINGQTAAYPAGQFTTGFPIPSFRAVNGVGVPQFDLNAATGDLLTTPVMQVGYYTVAVRADEYRRVQGTWTLIGSVTRDVVYSILNAGGNRNPSFTSLTVAGASAAQPVNQPIAVQPGQMVSLTLTAADPDAGQTVQLVSDVATVIPGASFQALGANQGVLTWQVPATLPAGRYNATVTVADSNCPTFGSEVQTLTFVVSSPALSTNAGRSIVLAAYPMPFHEQVQFKLPVAAVQVVTVTDGLGRVVATLKSRPDGTVDWQPANDVAAGLYFARPASGGEYVCRLLRQ